MSRCRTIEGLIASSVYEALDAQEAATLDAHLAGCARCRDAYARLRAMAAAIPSGQPEFTGDLLPALREQIRLQPRGVRVFGWWGFGAAMAAAALLAVAVGYTVQAPELPSSSYATVQPASPLVETMARASAAIDEAHFNRAYQILIEALADHPDDIMAGDAQMLAADLAYSQLYRYADAYRAYETLRMAYHDTFTAAPENAQRWALLAEAQSVQFASLEALEAARRAGRDSFAQLEGLIARYPTHMVASLAAHEMGRITAAEGEDSNDGVLAMERARARCTDPIAVARLDIELAEIYVTERADGAKACSLYQRVAASGNPALAQLAKDEAARLGADCGA